MKSKDILNMSVDQIMKLNTKDLRQAVRQLSKTANSRVTYADKTGATSPLLSEVREAGKFSTKGKNLNQLRNEFKRAKSFLESPLSTVKGIDKWKQNVIESLEEKAGVQGVTPENFDKFWKVYEKLKKKDPTVENNTMKYKVFSNIKKAVYEKGQSIDRAYRNISRRLNKIYTEAMQENTRQDFADFFANEESGNNDFSGFFEGQ